MYLLEMDVFEMNASAIKSLMSGTYNTIEKKLIVKHVHYMCTLESAGCER